ncbi:hypothetical protein [Nocardia brasiliensis]|uniref:DUF4440 domain-containing protein n=1 Tax=Nocardia brasiliensis (strain ATCC 700358 / HUJEG-1) TaxID=1133849 RepID=K0F950_NOCB7|nr:hypothetical protein [Nocardia brasiliensis]AFU04026.1 hypothetical protein O3I_030385 [Nocardia brasiliensis ATCC 700358]OCF91211.1 hypothetical protein AW168_05260 [Nocardia brasiliensis]
MSASDSLDPVAEVEHVHALLSAWLGTDADQQVLEQFAATQHDSFSMVTLDGARVSQSELLSGLRRAKNSRPGLDIEIDDVELLLVEGSVTVVRFLERHHFDGKHTDRRSTAVLTTDGAPPRYRWRIIQETAVPTD